MPFTFTMPKLSPTMEEGSIAKWHKKEGDYVAAGEVLLEIATDKATVEHQALDEGWLKKILVPEGNSAAVSQPIAIFTIEENESIEGFASKDEKSAVPLAEPAEEAPPAKQGEKVSSGVPLAFLQPAFAPEPPLAEEPQPPQKEGRIIASPLARRLAKKRGLDLSTVKGSGPGGRITSKDLEKAQPAGLVTFGRREAPTLAAGSFEELSLSPMRKIIARRLQESKSFIPHFYVKQMVDAEPIFFLREQLKVYELKISYNDMIVKACALALRQHPEVNSGFNSVNQTIVRFKTIDISIAVAIEEGLITPIVRYADYKNLGQIALEIKQLAEKARSLKLKDEEYKGGSFCVSNLGMFEITEFTAVINPPQAAILAVGGLLEQPVVKAGKVVPGKTITLTLSADHRVIDGAVAAQFLKTLQKILENPAALLL
jgi:pyruvate dehydrogenase E2 component (dihydrolipoamide acetyltransferase)